MVRVKFQNGPDAPEIILDDQYETKDAAKERLDWYAQTYGTVPEAVAWVDGDKKPRFQDEEADPEPKPEPVAGETPPKLAAEAPHPPDEAAKQARAEEQDPSKSRRRTTK